MAPPFLYAVAVQVWQGRNSTLYRLSAKCGWRAARNQPLSALQGGEGINWRQSPLRLEVYRKWVLGGDPPLVDELAWGHLLEGHLDGGAHWRLVGRGPRE